MFVCCVLLLENLSTILPTSSYYLTTFVLAHSDRSVMPLDARQIVSEEDEFTFEEDWDPSEDGLPSDEDHFPLGDSDVPSIPTFDLEEEWDETDKLACTNRHSHRYLLVGYSYHHDRDPFLPSTIESIYVLRQLRI